MGRIDKDPAIKKAYLHLCCLLWPQFLNPHDKSVPWSELAGFERLLVMRGFRIDEDCDNMVAKNIEANSTVDPTLRQMCIDWTRKQVAVNPLIRQAFLYCTRGKHISPLLLLLLLFTQAMCEIWVCRRL